MNLQLQGKKAIVTGGSAGIGLAVARMLAEEGVEVTIPGRIGKKLKDAIASLPGVVHGIEADLATAQGARKLIEQVPETDILVNNLGIYESRISLTSAMRIGCDISRSISSETSGWLGTISQPCSSGTRDASFLFPAKQAQKHTLT